MSQIPTLFNDNQQLDEYKIVDSLANKAPRTHKAMIISQGFNPKTGDLATFVKHWEQAETTDNIAKAKFSSSDEEINIMKNKRGSMKTKERENRGKKRHKYSLHKKSLLYCIPHGENTSHPSRECKLLMERSAEKDRSKYVKK